MKIFPAIDLFGGQAVRLFKGDYQQMTVYNPNPMDVALDFAKQGAAYLHLVDLEGARSGGTPNIEVISKISQSTPLFTQVGGGIRSINTVKSYLEAGVNRVILGTAAVTDEAFLNEAVSAYGEKIAVGIDLKDGYVAIKGWTEQSAYTTDQFFGKMQQLGVKTVICTDISRDGAMQGTNLSLYKHLSATYDMNIIASGGVSTIEDLIALKEMNLYGAIIGKAYYTGSINLAEAIEVTK